MRTNGGCKARFTSLGFHAVHNKEDPALFILLDPSPYGQWNTYGKCAANSAASTAGFRKQATGSLNLDGQRSH